MELDTGFGLDTLLLGGKALEGVPEGTALHIWKDGMELYTSTLK